MRHPARRKIRWIRNVFRTSSQFRKGATVCSAPPVRLWVEVTNLCNLRCIMCPTGVGREDGRGVMGMDLFRKVIDEAASFANDINLFGGGEPLLHPNLPEMVAYVDGRGMRSRLETNGTLLTPDLSRRLIDAGLDFISFSFDGYTRETYERIRAGADFEKTLDNIRTFLRIKGERRSRTPYTVVQVIESAVLLARDTEEDRRRFKRTFRGLPLDGFRIIRPHRYAGRFSEDLTGTAQAFGEEGKRVPFSRNRYTPCPYPWTSLNVLWDGRIVPCCVDFFGDYVLGDAAETPLLTAWNGERMRFLRKSLVERRPDRMTLCRNCDFLEQRLIFGVSAKNLRDFWSFLQELFV